MSDAAFVEEEEFVDELKPGTELMHGQYTIDSFLAAGGFGITYLAKDSLGRFVVIKECFPGSFCRRQNHSVMPRSRAHQNELKSIVRLFSQEAISLSKAGHPNVVGVHQVFEENNTAYMALDYVEGNDLLEILTEEPGSLEPATVEGYLKAMLGAIGHVHDQGILHRDISPDNIIIGKNDQPVLIDFGAARESASKASRMLSALRVVKDGYSPQEFYIAGSDQGPSCDLYSLAASFYHLITGNLPPDSQTRLTSFAAQQDDPYVPLASLNLGYSKAFATALDKAMSILPKDRMQSAQEWLDHLEGLVVAAAPITTVGTKAVETKSKTPLLLGGVTMAAAAVGAGVFFMPAVTTTAPAEEDVPVAAETAPIASDVQIVLPSSMQDPAPTKEIKLPTEDVQFAAQTETDAFAQEIIEGTTPSIPGLFDEALGINRDSIQLTTVVPDDAPTFETAAPILPQDASADPAVIVEPTPRPPLASHVTGAPIAPAETIEDSVTDVVSDETAAVAVEEQVAETENASIGTIEAASIVERTQRVAPFTLSTETPGVVESVTEGAPVWLVPGFKIVSVNGKPVNTNEDILAEIDATDDNSIAVGADARVDSAIIERPLRLSTETQTLLLNGLTFVTKDENGRPVTRVFAAPDGSNFTPGDTIVAYVNTAERLTEELTIKTIIERELTAGTTSFSFAVERGGQVWVEAFELAALN